MKKGFRSRLFILLLVPMYITASLGCELRPGVVSGSNAAPPPPPAEAIETVPPPPSPIFRKEKPQPSPALSLFSPLNGDMEIPGFYPGKPDSSHRLDAFNDYLYFNASVKTPRLTGTARAMNDFWNVAKYILAGIALAGFIETQNKR